MPDLLEVGISVIRGSGEGASIEKAVNDLVERALFGPSRDLTREQSRLRERFLDLMEEVLKIFYGPSFRRDRQAIDILVRAMDSDKQEVRASSREHLIRLTGQDLGEEFATWADWWAEHRATFRSPGLGVKDS